MEKGAAIWISEIGIINTRVFEIKKENNGNVLIVFSPSESYWIKKSNIRAKKIVIYQKSDGEIVVQNPEGWGKLELEGEGIKTLRFNLQNSSLQESKSSVHRWVPPQNAIDKLTPVFKLLFICIAVGVLGWVALKFGLEAFSAIMKSRVIDCKSILPEIPVPIGYTNTTMPLGV